uniref:CXorf2 n=1 Tax=Notamacropus eugenii TaxID=9315 RepID=Q3ZL98_NOTEU|nr:CXorf2 [Notamacropus eugenii]
MKSQSSSYPPNRPINRRPSCTSDEGSSGNPSQSVGEIGQRLQDNVKHHILYLSEKLKVEKTSRDENTVGYLKLMSKADRHQVTHIRQAFEKVNQRSSATIAHIERKLRQYHQQLREIEEGNRLKCSSLREEKAKKNQEATHKVPLVENPKPRTEEYQCTNPLNAFEGDKLAAALPQEKSSKIDSMDQKEQSLFMLKIKGELEDIKKSHSRLELSYQTLKEKYLTELQLIIESLQEEKSKQKVMEEQVSDYMQGHLSEISYIKQNLACAEEKMVYMSYERAKEIWVMRTFQNRISRLETQQQADQLEIMGKSRRHTQVFLFKFMSLLLTLTTILLICVSTICTCPFPFFRYRFHFYTILLLTGLGIIIWQKWYSNVYTHWHEWILSRRKL